MRWPQRATRCTDPGSAGGSGIAQQGLVGSEGVTSGAVADTVVAPFNQVPELDETVAVVCVEPVAANMGLVAPAPGDSVVDGLPTFEWTLGGRELESTIYISTFAPGEGLFPGDTTEKALESEDPILAFDGDGNRNRVYRATVGPPDTNGIVRVTLPDAYQLTAGQQYYWGVEVTDEAGRVHRKFEKFNVAPVTATSAVALRARWRNGLST